MLRDTDKEKMGSHLSEWVESLIPLLNPDEVHLCTGSDEEAEGLSESLVRSGTFTALKRPNSYLACSRPEDVARVEERTFICSEKEEDAGPTNNWRDPEEMKELLRSHFSGCMKGRTLYIIPYCMGPVGSPIAKIGVELTDSPYVVLNMGIMTRIGDPVLTELDDGPFVKGLHSVGAPLASGEKDVPWPCDPENRYIAHFPEESTAWSYGSGYGGNALLGKKCFALRLASVLARDEGWLAEHMLIVGITNPEGKKRYFAAAFPSACGKTNLAMMTPTLPGWKVETVGDDIAWMKFGSDGRLYAINPEAGFFGVAPGTSMETNPNAMLSMEKNSIFTNVGLTDEGDVWWEGMTDEPPAHLRNWLGHDWTPSSDEKAAHPNARFTAPASQCPVIDPDWEKPEGVPISGIIFGGRRPSTIPLVLESRDWAHGTFLGASVSSEKTAAAAGKVGELRHDPFAMLPFCGYHMGDYFGHWLKMGEKGGAKMPRIFNVNWFRKDAEGKFIWPGFGENIRVLKWMFERIEGTVEAVETPIGLLPDPKNLDLSDLDISVDALKDLFEVNSPQWQKEVENLETYFSQFEPKLPDEMKKELEELKLKLQ